MFLQTSVILSTGGVFFGGGSSKFSGGGSSKFSGGVFFWGGLFEGGVPPNFRGGVSNRNTVNVRPVRILLECILVSGFFSLYNFAQTSHKNTFLNNHNTWFPIFVPFLIRFEAKLLRFFENKLSWSSASRV